MWRYAEKGTAEGGKQEEVCGMLVSHLSTPHKD